MLGPILLSALSKAKTHLARTLNNTSDSSLIFSDPLGIKPKWVFCCVLRIHKGMAKRTTHPTDTLMNLSDLKAHMIYEHTLDDARLTKLLISARDTIERDANLCITEQVWTEKAGSLTGAVRLPKAPVKSVVLKYYDEDNNLQTLASTEYYLVADEYEATLYPKDHWETTYNRPDAWLIEMTCGMDYIPGDAIQACLMLCGAWDHLREGEVSGTITTEIKLGYWKLINGFRRGHVGW